MKNVLAISWEMPPMYGPRATQVARVVSELPALGWSPTVVCMDPRRGGPNWFDDSIAVPSSVRLVRVPSLQESFVVRTLWRVAPLARDYPDTARVWVRAATRAAIGAAKADPPAVMISFAQPWSDHLVGLRVHRATRVRWVAHFSDPWADSPYATPRQHKIWAQMEAAVVREATAVVFVTQQTADLVMKKYPSAWREKVAVVPHGFDRRLRTGSPAEPDSTRPLRMIYTGRFYRGARTPVALFEAIRKLNGRSPLAGRIEIAFVGPRVEEYRADAERRGVAPLMTFQGRVPPAAAAAAAAAADVLLVIDADSDGDSVFLPSKLVDYLAFRKTILGLTPTRGASAQLLRRLGCPVVPPDDTAAIAAAIEDLLAQWSTRTLAVGPAFDQTAAEFDIRNTARLLSDVLARACASGPIGPCDPL